MSNAQNQIKPDHMSAQEDLEPMTIDAQNEGDARADALVAELRAMQRKVAEILGQDVPEFKPANSSKSTKAA